jgi:lycopene cyclase domain-containing protein
MSLYLWLNIITFGTFFLSFDKKVAFYKHFKALFISIVINALIFIPWDCYFTSIGIWGFNEKYLLGTFFLHLPLEEWLFFVTVPYSCTFIHYVLKSYFKNPFRSEFSTKFWNYFSILILIIGLLNLDQMYTTTSFILCSVAILLVNYFNPNFMKDFMLTYLIALIPFIIVNSILTGSFTDSPVVWYNENHIFGIRLGTIPIEDTIYNMLLLLIPLFITDFLSQNKTIVK